MNLSGALLISFAFPMDFTQRDRRLSWLVLFVTAILTFLFQFVFFPQVAGFGFALFVAGVALGIFVIARAAHQENHWAFLFLVPVFFSSLANVMYEADGVKALSFVLSFLSLAFFAYWLSAPKVAFSDVQSFWPKSLVRETVFPFAHARGVFGKIEWPRTSAVGGVAIGVLLAIPFLLVFGALFSSGDLLFRAWLHRYFSFDTVSFDPGVIFRDVIVAWFFLGAGWLLAVRGRGTFIRGSAPRVALNRIAAVTFLVLVVGLFALYLLSQLAALFGGETYVLSQGLSYSEYARSGFFQFLAISGIVFGLAWFFYRATEFSDRLLRVLSFLLIGETSLVIFSATRRLFLYVDVYGLTVSRWWAFVCLALLGILFASMFVAASLRIPYGPYAKYAFLSVLLGFSVLLLVNTESLVARINIDRFTSGVTERIDTAYLARLSTDALPEVLAFHDSLREQVPEEYRNVSASLQSEVFGKLSRTLPADTFSRVYQYYILHLDLDRQAKSIRGRDFDWRSASLSRSRAFTLFSQHGF